MPASIGLQECDYCCNIPDRRPFSKNGCHRSEAPKDDEERAPSQSELKGDASYRFLTKPVPGPVNLSDDEDVPNGVVAGFKRVFHKLETSGNPRL